MKRFTAHGKFLALSIALLAIPVAAAALTGAGLPAERASEADAYDRIVPGMTRADDLAGLGFDTHAAAVANAAQLDRIKGRAADTCIAAGRYCTGYVFASRAGDVVLLVMDGRVTDKVILRA